MSEKNDEINESNPTLSVGEVNTISLIINELNKAGLNYVVKPQIFSGKIYFDIKVKFKYEECDQEIIFTPSRIKDDYVELRTFKNNIYINKESEISELEFKQFVVELSKLISYIGETECLFNKIGHYIRSYETNIHNLDKQ